MDFPHNIFSLFVKGGLVMYPLLVCSVIVVAVTIERCVYYNRNKEDVEELLEEVKIALKNNLDKNTLKDICPKGPVASMLRAGLSYPGCNRSIMKEAMEAEALYQISRLKVRLNYLDTIITLSPLLGLLGTVTGMMNSFSVLTISQGQPFVITAGVAEALIATAVGLFIAVVALFAHSYLIARVDYLISAMERSASRVLTFLPWEGGPK